MVHVYCLWFLLWIIKWDGIPCAVSPTSTAPSVGQLSRCLIYPSKKIIEQSDGMHRTTRLKQPKPSLGRDKVEQVQHNFHQQDTRPIGSF
ncbi:hypothetical protein F4803DRAFT_377111 [Xylaria telfairii]|nr:hypothetical protein F4803DRAFT_377111 [Xylaria telfairii]